MGSAGCTANFDFFGEFHCSRSFSSLALSLSLSITVTLAVTSLAVDLVLIFLSVLLLSSMFPSPVIPGFRLSSKTFAQLVSAFGSAKPLVLSAWLQWLQLVSLSVSSSVVTWPC